MLDKNYSEQSCGCKTTNRYYKSPYGKPSIRREGCWQGGYTEDKDRLLELLGGTVIPIRGGAHNRFKSYEDFTIVYDEDTLVAYVSKLPVPEGVEITNRDYWQPMNVSGYSDDNVIIVTDRNISGLLVSYTLEEVLPTIPKVSRKPGALLSFFNTEGISHWEIWQYTSDNTHDWENTYCWNPLVLPETNKIVLKKNIIDGVNTLTLDMMRKPSGVNTIFVIQEDFELGEDITIPSNSVLEFENGSISGAHNLTFNNTLLYGIPKIGADCICSGSIKNNELHVEWFGAVGDGTYDSIQGNIGTDNKNAFWNISRIINDSNGGTVIFEKGKVYNSSIDRFLKVRTLGAGWGHSVFDFRFTGNVIVDLNGSTVQLATNVNNRYNIFNFLCCEDCYIKNGNIIGDGRNHSYAPYNPDNYPDETATSYEWCCGINGSGSRVTIENVKVSHCCGDAVTEGGFNGYESYDSKEGAVIIRNCELSYCGRQGISMHSSLWATVEDTEIHHIGTYGTNPGFSPMSGIDIEYEDRLGTIGDIVIDNCYIHDTTRWNIVGTALGSGISQVPSEVRSLLINNCVFDGSVELVGLDATNGELVIDNSTFEGKSSRLHGADRVCNCKVGIRGTKLLLSGNFYNVVFYNNAESLTEIAGIGTDGDVKFYNCQFMDITYRDDFEYGFSTRLYGYPMKIEFYNCLINADINFKLNATADSYVKMYDCVCEGMSIQAVPELYANNCRFIDCAGRNTGPNQTSVNDTYENCSFINENTSYDGVDWGCVLPFIRGKFDFCKIETSQPIFADNWQTIGMNDNGAYRRCIIDYTSDTPYYGTIKNFTDCTVSGIN